MTLRWGMVGAGRVARTALAPAIEREPSSELVAVYVPDPDRARPFAAEHGGLSVHESLDTLLEEVDVVAIASPNRWHAAQVVAAAKAGRHVLCEKPLARDAAGAAAAVAAARANGIALGIDFQTRFYPAFRRARALIEDGSIGDVELIELSAGAGGRTSTWQYDLELTGLAVLHHVGIHLVDAACFLTGEMPDEGSALWRTDDNGVDMTVAALLGFRSGAIAYLNASERIKYASQDLRIIGTKGRLLATNATRSWLEGEVRVQIDGVEELRTATKNDEAYVDLVAAFVTAIQRGEDASPSGEDAARAERVVEGLAEAARTGCRIPFDLVGDATRRAR